MPVQWLDDEPGFASAAEVRAAYLAVLTERLARRDAWVAPLEDAREHL